MLDWASAISRRVFLWAAGAATLSLRPRADNKAPEDLTAGEILARMADVYARCRSYHDNGCVTTYFFEGEERVDRKPFSTAFVRPDAFRFEFRSRMPHPDSDWDRYLVWAGGGDVRTWWDVSPGVEREKSLSMALAGAYGVSGGSAYTVPTLLLPSLNSGWILGDVRALKRLTDADSDGVRCFRLRGTLHQHPDREQQYVSEVSKVTGRRVQPPQKGPYTVWVERATGLLRRLEESTRFDSFRTESTTVYEPKVDVPVSEEQLRFDPPHGQPPPRHRN